ncbi:MAG: preprotein translocase subunit SecA [Halioglobus sp.]
MNTQVSLLRPGVVTGQYPQRPDARYGWLDTMAARLTGFLRQHIRWRALSSDNFVSAVIALDQSMRAETEEALRDRVITLRQSLYAKGFEIDLVVESFAIIREMSYRKLGMRHHDVQLAGGFAMLSGKVAEMETGEGKTLTALLPACTAALAGVPVHVITVNDFLVARDASELSPVYESLGLSVGVIAEGMDLSERRVAYRCDVTYCTNKQIAFDYLKDSLLLEQESRPLHLQLEGLYRENPRAERLLMRGLCFAIVDEADSVLIDEARTPLVISGQGEPGAETELYHQALSVARGLEPGVGFTIRNREKQVELTEVGRQQAREETSEFGGIWLGSKRRREMITQALVALHIYQLDIHYLVKDDAIMIIDEYTGRVMADRSWEQGLHQMIEAKENCPMTGRQETLARISYQRFFRRYLQLAGMTGTAQEITGELWSVYHLDVQRVATHRPLRRIQLEDQHYLSEDDKWIAIVAVVKRLFDEERPVLLGTRTVADSERLSALLADAGLHHVVLNARQDAEEATVIAQAGGRAKITVATNMAGRGTDIRLEGTVTELGGLHVLATCFHEARRIDRQLFGRSGRQGDPGSFQTIVSLDDEIFTHYLGTTLVGLIKRINGGRRQVPQGISKTLRYFVQWRAELHHRRVRRELMKMDDNLGDILAFSGRSE